MKGLRSLLILMTIAVLASLAQRAEAGLFAKTSSGTVNVYQVQAEGDPAPSPNICGKRCITYRDHCRRRICCDCAPPTKVLLQVKDPCACCCVEVPVCIPACCKGAPTVDCRRGCLGRSVVTYSWCCGFEVRVVFDRCGNLIVHTFGAV